VNGRENVWRRLIGGSRAAIPAGVWALGFVSLLMDVSSETILALLPVYLVSVMGASMEAVGVVEGVAEATASIVKIFSGALSDWFGRRKPLAVVGYGLSALSKPIFPLAPTVGWVTAARFLDRVGKGIREAPRDALMADVAPPEARGASFGLRQALDTVGAFLGPLLGIGLMAATANDFRLVFWIAVIPAFLAVALLIVGVREPEASRAARPRPTGGRSSAGGLGPAFWRTTAIATLFALARFSEAFLVLRAVGLGLPTTLAPLVYVLMNGVYALAAYPAGALSDRFERMTIATIGFFLLVGADLALGFAGGLAVAALGVALWGLYLGLTQGVLSTLVADAAPAEKRGAAFGVFNLANGLAALAASLIAGALWDALGAQATFLAGAAFAAIALLGLLAWVRPRPLK
jgi:MFS family permease